MRKLFALIALLGCLFVAQSTLAATSAYGGCCLEGCKGMSQCAAQSCPVCTVPAAAAEPSAPPFVELESERFLAGQEAAPKARFGDIWTPPD